MNKKAKRRAFFVFVLICLAYGAVAVRLNDRLGMQRVTEGSVDGAPSGMHLAVPERTEAPETLPARVSQRETQKARGRLPGLAAAIVWYALGERWLDKEELIPVRHEGIGIAWKGPLDILREGDDEGLKEIGRMIGTKNLAAYLSKEGITVDTALSPEEIVLGKGMESERDRIETLYRKYVPAEWAKGAFPAPAAKAGPPAERQAAGKGADGDWMMPNLLNLPLRAALEQLSGHAVRLKVYGSGVVVDQTPRAFERLSGETECVLRGGMGKE